MVDDEEIDDKVAQFLEQQDMTERGLEKKADLTEVYGQDEVDDEQAKAFCRDIVRVLRMLKEKRDMELREVKLVVAIEDPRNDDARKMGIEDSSGVSRDEMAAALEQVAAGQLPNDRIALRVLHAELINWPFLDSDEKSAKYIRFEAKGAPLPSRHFIRTPPLRCHIPFCLLPTSPSRTEHASAHRHSPVRALRAPLPGPCSMAPHESGLATRTPSMSLMCYTVSLTHAATNKPPQRPSHNDL